MEYIFTLKYQLAEPAQDFDILVERLGEAGCDDGLVGIGLPGRIAIEFTREADSAGAALRSALADVRRAIPATTLIEATPDLVGLSDIAAVLGVSRQAVRKLMLAHAGFPVPLHEGSSSIWHLAEVLGWLEERGSHAIDAVLLETARAAQQVNLAKEARRLPKSVADELDGLIA
jgi:predicted DNA-binding transcriptional regulator AlpA